MHLALSPCLLLPRTASRPPRFGDDGALYNTVRHRQTLFFSAFEVPRDLMWICCETCPCVVALPRLL